MLYQREPYLRLKLQPCFLSLIQVFGIALHQRFPKWGLQPPGTPKVVYFSTNTFLYMSVIWTICKHIHLKRDQRFPTVFPCSLSSCWRQARPQSKPTTFTSKHSNTWLISGISSVCFLNLCSFSSHMCRCFYCISLRRVFSGLTLWPGWTPGHTLTPGTTDIENCLIVQINIHRYIIWHFNNEFKMLRDGYIILLRHVLWIQSVVMVYIDPLAWLSVLIIFSSGQYHLMWDTAALWTWHLSLKLQ